MTFLCTQNKQKQTNKIPTKFWLPFGIYNPYDVSILLNNYGILLTISRRAVDGNIPVLGEMALLWTLKKEKPRTVDSKKKKKPPFYKVQLREIIFSNGFRQLSHSYWCCCTYTQNKHEANDMGNTVIHSSLNTIFHDELPYLINSVTDMIDWNFQVVNWLKLTSRDLLCLHRSHI